MPPVSYFKIRSSEVPSDVYWGCFSLQSDLTLIQNSYMYSCVVCVNYKYL